MSSDSSPRVRYMCALKGTLTIQYGMRNSSVEAARACRCVGDDTPEHIFTHSPEHSVTIKDEATVSKLKNQNLKVKQTAEDKT